MGALRQERLIVWLTHVSLSVREEERKDFFFEKKKQKTSGPCRARCGEHPP
jgi:hypothetical protein